jgi:hypothetical protein
MVPEPWFSVSGWGYEKEVGYMYADDGDIERLRDGHSYNCLEYSLVK